MVPAVCLTCKWARLVNGSIGVCLFYECPRDAELAERRRRLEAGEETDEDADGKGPAR